MLYVPTIGLEVHVELKTASKMFCGCANDPHNSTPNTHVCPVCLAHPGSLPVPNKRAIELVLLFGRAVNAISATYSEFDRKNYFYPDIPKAYQISQYQFPFLTGGVVSDIALTRVHLEEDTARSQHDKGEGSLVDFNRAGVPLMELVTEPVLHDAATAATFAKELQLILRTIGISEANMEKGEMRVEANISVSNTVEKLGTKVEVKNLNSFKAVEQAIEFETKRQSELLKNGDKVTQETRGWDENRSQTFAQRNKETAKDYRYFPDPDIAKLQIDREPAFSPSRLDDILPEIPSEKRIKYQNLGLTSNIIETLLATRELDQYFTELLAHPDFVVGEAQLAANYLTSDITALLSDAENRLTDLQLAHFAELVHLLAEKKIGSRVAKDLLIRLFDSNESPAAIAEREQLFSVTDTAAIENVVKAVIAENETVADEYRAGKEVALKFLVGQGMKKTKGAIDPNQLENALIAELQAS